MGTHGQPPELTTLRHCWARWAAIVGLFARRGRGRFGVKPSEYERVYRGLLQSCRALANTPEGSRQDFYRHLHELVVPWLTVGVLAHADGEVLSHLLEDCHRLSRELGAGPRGAGALRGVQAAARLLAGPAVLAAGLAGAVWLWRWGVAPVSGWWRPLWEAVEHPGATTQLFAIGIGATLIAVYLVARAVRS
jgi:hypothetical protein